MGKDTALDGMPLLMVLPLLYKQVMSAARDRRSGLTKAQIIILSSLALHGTLHMSQIARYLSSSKEQATRAVAVLVDAGYLERFQDAADRTRIYVRLTPGGQAILDRWRRELADRLYTDLAGSVTPAEREELLSAARTMIRILGRLD